MPAWLYLTTNFCCQYNRGYTSCDDNVRTDFWKKGSPKARNTKYKSTDHAWRKLHRTNWCIGISVSSRRFFTTWVMWFEQFQASLCWNGIVVRCRCLADGRGSSTIRCNYPELFEIKDPNNNSSAFVLVSGTCGSNGLRIQNLTKQQTDHILLDLKVQEIIYVINYVVHITIRISCWPYISVFWLSI